MFVASSNCIVYCLFMTSQVDTETENQILSIGDEFLPECARAVRDGGEATPEYHEWLCGQVEQMNREAERLAAYESQ